MDIVFCDRQMGHRPGEFLYRGRMRPNPETAERVDTLLDAVRAAGHRVIAPADPGPGPREAVHTAPYLAFLATAYDRWKELPAPTAEVLPNIFAGIRQGRRPSGIIGQAGYYMADTSCPIGPRTWEAVCRSADSAATAARQVREQGGVAYALCRPPGHHAYADMTGGFCFLNNAAIAAEELRRRHDRVAVLDVDVHHGNGTQGIFWERPDVFFASLHADPADYYPWFAGYAEERGAGAGTGTTLNLPLAPGSDDAVFLEALARACAAIDGFGAQALVISLGLDAAADDPLGVLKVTEDGFHRIGAAIAALDRPTVLVQEGGYPSPTLGRNLVAVLAGVEGGA